jgi:hypothetical protein
MRFPATMTTLTLILVAVSVTACSSKSTTSVAPPSTSNPVVAGSAGTGTAINASAGGAPSSVDVCSLLSAAQASSIVGVTFTVATPNFGGKMCTYAGGSVPMDVTLTVSSGTTAAWTEELATLKLGGGDTPVALSGLGDRAAETTGSLATQSGNWIIQIDAADESSVNGGNIGGDFTKSIAVARAILAAQH